MINRIIKEINNSLSNGNYLIALMAALALPDFCSKAEYPTITKQEDRYVSWCEMWISKYETYEGSEMPYLTGKIIYELRNSLVHEGSPKVHEKKHNLTKFRLYKGDSRMIGGSSQIDSDGTRCLEINILNLIWKLCICSEAYYKENKDKFAFLENVQLDF